MPGRTGRLRHIGFEDDAVAEYSSARDVNGIEWEFFSPALQDSRIVAAYGTPVGR